MREFASHSASMMLRHCSSNCRLFSYSLMMDCSARQWTGGVLHYAAPSCPVFSANFTFKIFIHPRKIEVKSCYQSLDKVTLPSGFFLLDSSPPIWPHFMSKRGEMERLSDKERTLTQITRGHRVDVDCQLGSQGQLEKANTYRALISDASHHC